MFAKINHVAMASANYALVGKFYQVLFGLRTSRNPRPESAVTVGDGYIGLNVNPRRPGRAGGLDHFGFEVEDVETVFERCREKYPTVKWLQRPSNRPFAGISTHDPDGNMFDLSQRAMENRDDIYIDGEWKQERTINHYALRTMNPERCAEFYKNVFELNLANRGEGDENYYITDGRMTLVLMPWDITKYEGTGISRPGPDHFGFKVESVEAVKHDMAAMIDRNQALMPPPVGVGPEGKARLRMFDETCPMGQFHLADPEGVLIDVGE